MITHLKTADLAISKSLHISHIMKYVSAYEPTKEMWKELAGDIEAAIKKAKRTRNCQYVDQDGEMFLEISPGGYISLCMRWRMYQVNE
jgi:hypothetical protein